ncbi:MAG TPA: alpha/beta hydrolase [Candidatus Binataceae bacterium]|nr:alpha/beta hydrolase [Candidatus Binataceae bacterium]
MAGETRAAKAKSIFKHESLTVNGIKTAVMAAGQGEPLVFFHGGGVFSGFDFALPWTERFKVYIPFHPGFGDSDDDSEIVDMHDYVLHYLELFDQLKLDRGLRLVGFSLGGWMAAEFAMEHRRRLHKLVLVAPAGLRVKEQPGTDLFRIAPEQVPAYLVHDLKVIERHLPKEPDADFLAARYREMTAIARIAWERPYSHRLARWLHRINVPTLMVWGEQDRLLPHQQAASWAKLIPGARVQTFGNAGHLVLDENPEAVKAVAEFLT